MLEKSWNRGIKSLGKQSTAVWNIPQVIGVIGSKKSITKRFNQSQARMGEVHHLVNNYEGK